MNEQQAEELIMTLKEIRDILKPKQEIVKKEIYVRPSSVEKLMKFKETVTENSFWNALNHEQREKLLKL